MPEGGEVVSLPPQTECVDMEVCITLYIMYNIDEHPTTRVVYL